MFLWLTCNSLIQLSADYGMTIADRCNENRLTSSVCSSLLRGVRNEKNIWLTSWPFQNDWRWSPNRHHLWLGSVYRRTKRSRAVPFLRRAGRPQSPRWWPAHEPPCSVHALQSPLPAGPAFRPGLHLVRFVHSNTNGQNLKSLNYVSLYASACPPDTYLLHRAQSFWRS